MEVFVQNIPPNVDDLDLKEALATSVKKANGGKQKNFSVKLHRNRPGYPQTGILTFPTMRVAKQFIYLFGPTWNGVRSTLTFQNYILGFRHSHSHPSPDLVTSLKLSHWVSPETERKTRELEKRIQEAHVWAGSIQFGWMCRDDIFSIESEAEPPFSKLCFDAPRRELHVIIRKEQHARDEFIIAIPLSSILSISLHKPPVGMQDIIVFMQIETPPLFFQGSALSQNSTREKQTLSRMATLPFFNNPSAIPYTSLAVRLILPQTQRNEFLEMATLVSLRKIEDYPMPVTRRDLFSKTTLELLEHHFRTLNWCVAFQLESLIRNAYLDAGELLELIPDVRRMIPICGKLYVASLLRSFGIPAKDYLPDEDKPNIISFFKQFAQKFRQDYHPITDDVLDNPNLYQSYHVTVTPTSMFLTGPFPEKSNRVIRKYDRVHQECFLRVSFRDEKEQLYRYDPDVTSRSVICAGVEPHMTKGLIVAGRTFKFLAYSMSALNAHSIWFVKSFRDDTYGDVDAQKIIDGLGTFKGLLYDQDLIYRPARYGARISQAFSATDAYNSENIVANILIIQKDTKTPDGRYNFTDGCGGISPEFAQSIWKSFGKGLKGAPNYFAQAFQVRFQGSKGMLCVDDTLHGQSTIALRPSMIKFEAPAYSKLEISRIVDHPTTLLLNRPLIMVLEQLGVPYTTFKRFQDHAVDETQKSTRSLHDASILLQKHGLGASFRLPSTMLNLAKLGLTDISSEYTFYRRLLEVGIFHILRELKYHSRIPIPNAWNLVGVADPYTYLQEGQIFVAIRHPQAVGSNGIVEVTYLEGPVIISRSPVVHPGDVQIATAIGKPPKGSSFEKYPLSNTIVFSVVGNRPLSTCLGGGDLDGDEYNIIPLEEYPLFRPAYISPPADYTSPEIYTKRDGTPCNMDDVANFVMDYMISDTIGLVATNWLMFADINGDGIWSKECLKLAKLHSDAVDYRKTGIGVGISIIPKVGKIPRPDWMAPETVDLSENMNYYESNCAIGKLARAINLDTLSNSVGTSRTTTPGTAMDNIETLSRSPQSLSLGGHSQSRFQRPGTTGPDPAIDSITKVLLKKIAYERCPASLHELKRLNMKATTDFVEQLFTQFSSDLLEIATICNLPRSYRYLGNKKQKPLSEEELIIGTITAKTSQHRIRQDKMGKLRERTEIVVDRLRDGLKKPTDIQPAGSNYYFRRAWIAWLISRDELKKSEGVRKYGAELFGWVALGAVFDAMPATSNIV